MTLYCNISRTIDEAIHHMDHFYNVREMSSDGNQSTSQQLNPR